MVEPPGERNLTALSAWCSVGRVPCAKEQTFELVLVRARPADPAQGVSAVVLIASSKDEHRTHLHALATLAARIEQPETERRWGLAGTQEELRAVLLGPGLATSASQRLTTVA